MKFLAILLMTSALGLAPPAHQAADETVALTGRQAAACQAEGGCVLITQTALDHLVRQAFADGKAQACTAKPNT